MNLDEVQQVLNVEGVEQVTFEESVDTVHVLYSVVEVFESWPYGASDGTQQQKEAYYQEIFGVDWSLEDVTASSELEESSEVAVFSR